MREEFENIVGEQTSVLNGIIKNIFAEQLNEYTPTAHALAMALEELGRHNGLVLAAIAERLEWEAQGERHIWDDAWRVATTLKPKSEDMFLRIKKFQPMLHARAGDPFGDLDEPEVWDGPYFLNLPYPQVAQWYNKPLAGSVGGQSFRYELRPDHRFLEVEKMLNIAGRLYNIRKPLIFSPWSRRAVSLHILDGFTVPKKERPSPLLAENGLEGILLHGHDLYWNVREEKIERAPATASPYKDSVGAHYVFDANVDERAFILPDLESMQFYMPGGLKAVKTSRAIHLYSPEPLKSGLILLRLAPPEGVEQIYDSMCSENLRGVERPRTAAEINYVLNSLAQAGFSAQFAGIGGKEPALARYVGAHRYPLSINEPLFAASRNRPIVAVKFKCNPDNEMFLEDYVEYALSFLEEYYPEYMWKGIRDGI